MIRSVRGVSSQEYSPVSEVVGAAEGAGDVHAVPQPQQSLHGEVGGEVAGQLNDNILT